MKRKLGKKSIGSLQTRKDYKGEGSPYWDFIKDRHRRDNRDVTGEFLEDVFANPDLLAEDEGIQFDRRDEHTKLKLQAIYEAIERLSPQQRNVLELCGLQGMTLGRAAEALGVEVSTIQTHLEGAKQKIKSRYLKLLIKKDS